MASNRSTMPIATGPRRKQGRRIIEARSIMEGELSSIGPQGLSNSRVTVPRVASPNLRRVLLWIFPLIYAIFYAPEYYIPLDTVQRDRRFPAQQAEPCR